MALKRKATGIVKVRVYNYGTAEKPRESEAYETDHASNISGFSTILSGLGILGKWDAKRCALRDGDQLQVTVEVLPRKKRKAKA